MTYRIPAMTVGSATLAARSRIITDRLIEAAYQARQRLAFAMIKHV